MPATDLSEADKKINVESRLLEYLSRRGGQRIVAGPEMDGLVADLVNETYALAREGFLPPADDGVIAAAPATTTTTPSEQRSNADPHLYRLVVVAHRPGPPPVGRRYVRDIINAHSPVAGETVVLYDEDDAAGPGIGGPTAAVRQRYYAGDGVLHVELVPFDVDPDERRRTAILAANEASEAGWADSMVWITATDGDLDAALTAGGWRRW